MAKPRVAVVEDHARTRAGLRTALASYFEVVGEAADGSQGFEMILGERPDIAVIDIALPGMDGISFTGRVRHQLPETRVVILTMIDVQDEVIAALAAGADAYCLKTLDGQRIVDAVCIAAEGGAYFDPANRAHRPLALRLRRTGEKHKLAAHATRNTDFAANR